MFRASHFYEVTNFKPFLLLFSCPSRRRKLYRRFRCEFFIDDSHYAYHRPHPCFNRVWSSAVFSVLYCSLLKDYVAPICVSKWSRIEWMVYVASSKCFVLSSVLKISLSFASSIMSNWLFWFRHFSGFQMYWTGIRSRLTFGRHRFKIQSNNLIKIQIISQS